MMGKEETKMNQNLFEERETLSEENAAKKNRRNNIIAFIICVFLAFSLWLMIRNADDTGAGVEPPPANTTTTEQAQ